MPKSFPPISKQQKETSSGKLLLAGFLAFVFAGAIYGVSLWSALLVLRQAGAIDEIISYRWCVCLAYIYLFVRFYDKNLTSNR
jgi:hypothetical protein